jgi:hypothetical protein
MWGIGGVCVCVCVYTHTYIQGDQNISVHLMITTHYLAQSDCLAADRQGQGHTRLTLTPSFIPNSKYVIMVSDCNCLKYVCVFFFTVIITCTETFDHTVYIYIHIPSLGTKRS